MQNYYDLMQINAEEMRKKSEADIKQQLESYFRQLSLIYHPDRPGGDHAKFQELNEARLVLLDPKRRLAYDAMLKQQAQVRVFEPHSDAINIPDRSHGMVYRYQALCDLSLIQKEYDQFVKAHIGENDLAKELGYSSALSRDEMTHSDMLSVSFPNESQRLAFVDLLVSKGMIKDPGMFEEQQAVASHRPSAHRSLGETPRYIKES